MKIAGIFFYTSKAKNVLTNGLDSLKALEEKLEILNSKSFGVNFRVAE